MKVKEIKKGTWFTKKPIDFPNDSQVWIRDDYDKSEKKYLIYRFSDINDYQYIKGDKEIFVDFTF